VRQLENAVFRAVVLAEGAEIGLEEFPQITAHVTALAPDEAPKLGAGESGSLDAPPFAEVAMAPSADTALQPAALPPGTLALLDAGEVRPLDEIEAEAIRFAIAHYRGQMSEVARRLRIGRSTLYRKLDILGLSSADKEATDAQDDAL
jgi:DNA-binding NtrC family response regulator